MLSAVQSTHLSMVSLSPALPFFFVGQGISLFISQIFLWPRLA